MGSESLIVSGSIFVVSGDEFPGSRILVHVPIKVPGPHEFRKISSGKNTRNTFIFTILYRLYRFWKSAKSEKYFDN